LILIMVWLKWLRYLPWLCAFTLMVSIAGLNTSYATSLDPFVSGFPHWWGYFACGCIFYLIKTRGFNWRYGLLMLLGLIFCVRQPQVFSEMMKGWYGVEFNAWVLVISNLVFFAVMSVIALRKTGLLRSPYFYYAGVLTYPLYLLHQNIGYMLFNALHQYISGYWLMALAFILFVLAAWLVHIWVEKPLRQPLKRFLLWVTRAPAAKPYAGKA
jgi:peptidoglycan/LPS O-acetylase OafA/YrhL